MNVVLGSHYFHPHVGGIESVIESHAERLVERDHDVTVISSDVGADALHDWRDGYRIQRYRAWNPVESLGVPYPLPDPIEARRRIGNVFADVDADLVHVHGMNYLTTSAVLRYKPPEIPVVMHQHTPFVEYPFPFRLVEQFNDFTVGRRNLRHANTVLCVSSEIEQYVHKLESDIDTQLMMNGVDTDYFHPNRANGPNPFDCDPDTPVLFTVSRMSGKKGIDTLLTAASKLAAENVLVHLAVAGDGPMRGVVEQSAAGLENVEVFGKVSNETLAQCYAAATGFLFTSKGGEAFPTLTMMEAYASGTPVIASNLGANPGGVEDGSNTLLVEPGDADELTAAVVELVTDEDRAATMGAKARESAERHFSIERTIDRLEAQYRSILIS